MYLIDLTNYRYRIITRFTLRNTRRNDSENYLDINSKIIDKKNFGETSIIPQHIQRTTGVQTKSVHYICYICNSSDSRKSDEI